jgi:hypothetical protein
MATGTPATRSGDRDKPSAVNTTEEAASTLSGQSPRSFESYPVRRGQGIGGSLLRAAASELANLSFSVLRLAVLTANLPARRFYEAMGTCSTKGSLMRYYSAAHSYVSSQRSPDMTCSQTSTGAPDTSKAVRNRLKTG